MRSPIHQMAKTKNEAESLAGLSRIRDLMAEQATGVLKLSSPTNTDHDVFLMNGEVIACSQVAEDWLFGRLLVASASVSIDDLAPLLEAGNDLIDGLMQKQLLPMDEFQTLQGECFRDNLVYACVGAWVSTDFEAQDAVFPPNMQLGFDAGTFLDETIAWNERAQPLLDMLDRRQNPAFELAPDAELPGNDEGQVVNLLDRSANLSELLAFSPLVRYRTLAALVRLISSGIISISVDKDSDIDLASLTQELEPLTAPVVSGEMDLPEGAAEELSESEDALVEEGIDYDKVEAGGHVKVYDVLDKVDLSHVETFPDRGGEEIEAEEEIIEAAAEHSIELGEASESVDVGDGDGDGSVYSLDEPASFEGSDVSGSLETDAPPIHLTGTEDSIEFFIDVDEDDNREVEARFDTGTHVLSEEDRISAGPVGKELPFSEQEIAAFSKRIEVFNKIFRIIFETFREPLGAAKTRDRFNTFLGDDSLQYPALFKDISVEEDGTLDAGGLLHNLADGEHGELDSYLHQGLYELIYVHLYDAKDVLTPDQEQSMMDQIATLEEDLHG